MNDILTTNLAAFEYFIGEKGWSISSRKELEHGRQLVVTDGTQQVHVSFYHTGKIVVQGKHSSMQEAVENWKNSLQINISSGTSSSGNERQNRVSKYLVLPGNIDKIRDEVVFSLLGDVTKKEPTGSAELYRVEVHQDNLRITLTQYQSGTLIVQGRSSPLFDLVCEVLDQHLTQSFSDRAARFVPGDDERNAVTPYLESGEAENEARSWLLGQIGKEVLNFFYENDQKTLLAAAGILNAICKVQLKLPDYTPLVMPFARAFEGFMIGLAVHLKLVDQEGLEHEAKEIKVGEWLKEIESRLPDPRRFSDVSEALSAAWQCRHKAVHSDFAFPMRTLGSIEKAEQEIATILRAVARSHCVFVEENVQLSPQQGSSAKSTHD